MSPVDFQLEVEREVYEEGKLYFGTYPNDALNMDDYGARLKKCCEGQCKLHRLLEGSVRSFPGNASLAQYFSAGFNETRIEPDKPAIVHHEKTFTFMELEEISDKIAEIIRDTVKLTRNQNPDGDSVIAVCVPPSSKLIFVLFAIHKLGAAYVPIDVSFPEDRVFRIIKDCKPLLIISNHHTNYMSKFDIVKEQAKLLSTQDIMNQVYGKLSQLDAVASVTPQQEAPHQDQSVEAQPATSASKEPLVPLPGHPVLAERTAIILYTSGSSGEPKGVRLSHRAVMNRLSWQWYEFPFATDEVCCFKTSLTFVDSVAEIFGPLLQGYPLIIFDKTLTTQPSIFMEKLGYYRISRVTLVPSLLRAIFQTLSIIGRNNAVALLSSVRLWICSGEPLPYDLLSEFFELYPRKYTLANFYGSTEIMGDVTYVAYNSREEAYKKVIEKHVPIGLPVSNTVVYVLDQDLNMIENGEIGEIYIAGYNLATNYVGGNHLDKFVENPFTKTSAFRTMYRTGDFGQINVTQDGTRMLFYEGRVDSQVKVRGQRVDLAEIELALSEIHLVSKVVVLCYRPGDSDQTLLAYVVPTERGVTQERIEPMIAKRLREYERPVIKFIDEIPLLVNGKTDRQRLLKMHEKELSNREEFEDWHLLDLPTDKIETAKVVLRVMSNVTGTSVETLAENIDNSFFNVGGTSLNAVVVVIRLRQHNLFISVTDFANAKIIRHVILSVSVLEGTLKDDDAEESVESHEESSIAKIDSHGGGSHTMSSKYSISQLTEEDKEDAVHTIAYSFSKKGDLEAYTKATYKDFRELIENIWTDIVSKGHSFIVRRAKDLKCVGVSLNFDVYDEPESVECSKGIAYVLDMLEFIESRQRQKLPKGRGKLLHSFMMGTHDEVDEAETVAVVETMEEYVMLMASDKKFMGVMTTNTNPLTRQIDLDLHGYEVLNEYQVNKYTAPDGTRPFMLAPDSLTIVCCWKQIPGNQMDMF